MSWAEIPKCDASLEARDLNQIPVEVPHDAVIDEAALTGHTGPRSVPGLASGSVGFPPPPPRAPQVVSSSE